jgi:subtilisin family serine protease
MLRRWLTILAVSAVAAAIAAPLPAGAAPARGTQFAEAIEDGTVLVGFTAGTSRAEKLRHFAAAGAVEESTIGSETHKLKVGSGRVGQAIATLKRQGKVRYAEPNYIVHATLVPNDPSFGQLWGLQNTGQNVNGTVGTAGADIKAVPAWNISTGSPSVVVGVVDTGIDYTHPDLAANVWSNPGGVGGCAVGTHGFNAITNTCDPMDDNNHGSHVSGTIGAVGNNGVGVAGINWTTSLMGLKFLNSAGSGTTAGAISAMDFAVNAKIAGVNVRALNNSWGGGGFSQALLDEINKAGANNILFVAAAGNNASNNDAVAFYPASYGAANEIAVAATTQTDALASFSNYGANSVQLGAPGTNILSTVVGGGYSYFNGTSMATPHVTGSAALVLSKCAQTTAQVKTTLMNNVDPIPALSGITVTGGRLNVNRALQSCATPDFSLAASPASQTVTQGQSTSYTVTVSSTGGFSAAVALSATPAIAGVTYSFAPASVTPPANGSATSTLTVSTTATATTGSFTVTITGSSTGLPSRTTTVGLVIQAPPTPDFAVGISPASQSISPGQSTTYTVTVSSTGGFSSAVALAASPAISGVTYSFAPASVTPPANGSATSTLTVATTAAAAQGNFTITVTGTSGTVSRSATAGLTIQAAPAGDFTLSATPSLQSISPGDPTSYTITVTSMNGFTSPVTLSVTGMPAGASGSFSANPITPPANGSVSSTLNITTTGNLAFGTYILTITATGGGQTHSTTVTLEVAD